VLICLTVFDAATSLGLVQLYFAELQSRLAKAAAAAAPDVKGPVIAGNFEFELNRNLAVLFGRG
jgi:hypothetical protein